MDEKMEKALNESLAGLARFQTKPTEKLWNKTAKEYGYLSSLTMKLVTSLCWDEVYLEAKKHNKKQSHMF